ncbi:MAG TPA: hypothetical protein VGM92_03635 [Candidatus Kapabacteria bacterium]
MLKVFFSFHILWSSLFSIITISFLTASTAHGQSWSDSLSKEDRFWSRSGGEARELSLGAGGFGMLGDTGVSTLQVNPFSVDPLFVLQNPAYASHYPSYVWFDAGWTNSSDHFSNGSGQSFAGLFGISDAVTAGIVLAKSDAQGFSLVNPNIFGNLTSLSSGFTYSPPANTWEVMTSYQAGNVSIGAALSYARSAASTTSADSSTSSITFHQMGLSLGAIWRAPDGNMLDLDITELMPDLTSQSDNTGELTMNLFGVNARYFFPLHDEFYLVPMFNLYYGSGTSTIIATPKDLPSSVNYDAGIGVNFWQAGLHVMSGISFGSYNQTTPAVTNISPEVTKTETIVPRWTIGIEWPIVKWLTARLGYFASSGSESNTITGGASSSFGDANLYASPYTDETSGLTAGLTFAINRFTIDATLHDETFHAAPANIVNGNIFGFVTLGYRFDH